MKINKKGKIAICEILILIVGIFAFGWLIGSEMKLVKAQGLEREMFENLDKTPPLPIPGAFARYLEGGKIIVKNFGWAVTVYSLSNWAAKKIGVDKDKAKIVGGATAVTYLVTHFTTTKGGTPYLVSKWAFLAEKGWWGYTWAGWATPIIFAVTTAIFYKDKKTKTVVFDCRAWDASTGGKDCEKCNKQGILGCSEYQCRALGQGCEMEEGKCVWKNEKDKDYPVIKLDEGALLEGYKYKDKTSTGVKIINTVSSDGCVEAFTPLIFGVTTNEIATCKIDSNRTNSFDKMAYTIGGRSYNHTIALSLPSPNMTDSPVIQPGEDYKFYVKCQDTNGNENPAAFLFSFCVEEGPPSQTAPIIVATSIPETSPYVSYDTEEIGFNIGVNRPSYCKWDTQDKTYDDMINVMNCGDEEIEMNVQMLYECSTTLKGIVKGDNKFYFRCKNTVEGGKANTESYPFTIKRTQELLAIDETYTSPKETVRGSTEFVKAELKIKTKKGANEGNAICYYGEDDDYEGGAFFKTNSYEHLQELNLEEGSYTYYVKCVDAGGDTAKTTITFDVESDQGAPAITRIYKEENDLKIITNENAECVYGKDKELKCDYEYKDGTAMTTYDNLEHTASWDVSSTYYIKCKDEYENLPEGDCSVVVRASS